LKVLVTGATGFLGRHLVRLLRERGDDVTAIVRPGTDPSGLDVEIFRGDVLDVEAVRAAAAGRELVLHLAGLAAYERRDLPRLRRANVDSVRSVVSVLGGARLVHVSSVAAIGPAPERNRPVDEEHAFPPHAQSLPYSATKREGELIALGAARAGADVVVANPAFVLGPGDRYASSTFIVSRYLQGALRFHTEGGLSYVHVEDVARGILTLAERGRRGERYALANRAGNLSYEEFFERVAAVTGVRRRMIGLPRALAVAGARIVPWPLGPGAVRASANWWFYDPAKAERELGFANRPLDETIAETAADYGYDIGT
jgi:dihydroflavonol-4-reductase